MTYNKQLIAELHDIEVNTIKREKDFSIRTLLIDIFKALYSLFHKKENVSKQDLVNVAEQESKKLGIEKKYDWNKVIDVNSKTKVDKREETSINQENKNSYPENFFIGKSIGNGSCFFDSFRQSLSQQKGIEVTVEQLRKDCEEFASSTTSMPKWFETGIKEKNRNGNSGNKLSNLAEYRECILHNRTWGDPDIEGRVLCAKYGVKLHLIEANPWHVHDKEQDQFLHQIIGSDKNLNSDEDSKSIREVSYNDGTIVHIINSGMSHFEPLLDRNKPMVKAEKNLQQEQNDFELARKLQVEEDFKLAKEFQIKEGLEYLNIEKNDILYQATRLKIENVLGLINNPKEDTRSLKEVTCKPLIQLQCVI